MKIIRPSPLVVAGLVVVSYYSVLVVALLMAGDDVRTAVLTALTVCVGAIEIVRRLIQALPPQPPQGPSGPGVALP